MKKYGKKGFTLIELIAVLVIMAIIALIATPLVMSIIRKARVSADKRSIDAYGRSIELAIAGYLLDNGKFPTEVSQLTIEYSGNQVVCSTTQINSDSSVYLAGCTVAGRNVDGYTYGKGEVSPSSRAYSVGDEVSYNNVGYYVIEDSSASDTTVKLLKKTPLTVAEVNQYGTGHINKYTYVSQGTTYDLAGSGGVAYYTSETCGYVNDDWIDTGCTSDYVDSDIKYIVDAWANSEAPLAVEARLITKDEIDDNMGYEEFDIPCGSCGAKGERISKSWMYNSNYSYWTMSVKDSLPTKVWGVSLNGSVGTASVNSGQGTGNQAVRPVIVLSKSAL